MGVRAPRRCPLAQLSSSVPHWNNPLPQLSSIRNSKHNTQASLACLHTRTHACTHNTSACLHALVRLCYGPRTGPKQAVAHVFMPVMSVGNPSMLIAAKMGVQGCRDGVHVAPGPYW